MKDILRRICELQPSYSSENTPEMQERGRLVRRDLRNALLDRKPEISAALGPFGDDVLVQASDGKGPKTELPWARFCSKRMSPKPTEGFYSVFHFSTDGSAVHITVGCGSSRLQQGSFVPLPDAELDAHTAWARSVIKENRGDIAPFTDIPDFGARRKVPISFQRATAVSKRIGYNEIEDADIDGLIRTAALMLRSIYEAQSIGRDLSPADQSEAEILATLQPHRQKSGSQGYGLPPAARKEVELRAMKITESLLKAQGYELKDTSAHSPFDFEAVRGPVSIKVEVKGTTSDNVDAILMTRNEVELHRKEKGKTALVLVCKIKLIFDGTNYSAEGGTAEALFGWDIDGWKLEPTAYRVARRKIEL